MIHPVFRLAAAQPQLLAEHAAGYASLLSEALAASSARWQKRAAFLLAGAACLAVAAVLAGVAVMLWAALPEAATRNPWPLLLTPLVPALLGAGSLWLGQNRHPGEPFAVLRLQLAEDAALLRRTGTP
ncbi:MAG: hypothetical protein Q8K34_00640 [Hydrogenophaga sp.]|jgi:hypothetical protein|uniref:hypothetical protein n=1 Tax=Hydrogenophaga sp. TaxID=1904254 RepID=UPI002718C4CA|nr:hypothetical protein [Hydrogenophaga sp.]MDO9199905.1 hypothetical protein [Hydrogenophaga sp.]MDO9484244.1 hypothetical protein [Hydrogenophaga sp.]MDO9568650.1 hypothetical protein [Hydrogenophaga sp.]MDP1893107.1 hypothetical protein [Hydrogenophaga sp.]MDP2093108.1 hypothetical protein [Hydrogenophaga sp.]